MLVFTAPVPLALYVHIPWCARKCPYCDFNSHEARGPLPERAYVDALLVDPLNDGFIQGIGAAVEAMGGGDEVGKRGVSYSLSKRGVHLLTERWGMKLGPKGVRVVSISPGVIHTPMGLSENEQTPGAADTMNAASIGRIGTPMDIAMAARFLCSDEAGFITACDLKVDGGSTATVLSQR